jgi:copper(I)-binding protein
LLSGTAFVFSEITMTHLCLHTRLFLRTIVTAMAFVAFAHSAAAQSVQVQNPWARATVQAQKSAGVFMNLTSPTDARLVGASSPVAAIGEVHEMRLEGDVMKMHPLKGGLELPAGKTVELKPGSYHIMLMDLKTSLAKDTTIPLTLVFADAKGLESKTELTVPVKAMAHMGAMAHTN